MRQYKLLLIPTLTLGTLVGCNTVGDRYTNGTLQGSSKSAPDGSTAVPTPSNNGTNGSTGTAAGH